MIVLNYPDLENEAIAALDKQTKMVLATCAGNRVTARTMSIVHQGLLIMFQTDVHFTKHQQIRENPNVALAAGNLQIEGTARITCHPYDNPGFIEKYCVIHESAFRRYSHLKENVIIEVDPCLITFWKYDENRNPYRDFLDVAERKAYREYYLSDSECNK